MAVAPFSKVLGSVAWEANLAAYKRIRSRYGWNDEPVVYRARTFPSLPEPMPAPKHLRGEAYTAYSADVGKLRELYNRALGIAEALGKKRHPKLDGYDGDVRELLVDNLQLVMNEIRETS